MGHSGGMTAPHPMSTTLTELPSHLGDRSAALRHSADALVRMWASDVLRWCRMLCDGRVHPDDACQDVLLILSQTTPEYDEPHRLRGWLWGVTWRTVRAHQRKAWVRRWLPGNASEGDLTHRAPAPSHTTELNMAVKRVLDALPTDQRRLLWLAYAEGATRPELCEHLGLSAGTLNRRLTAARRAFAKEADRLGLTLEDSHE
ncbi:MAG: RNA polymerase sigma factor (sigma-70 family) [Kiritimatiellia bacterium]|jgi:RNA polymerase sigma factor (sigma-70 family)